MMPPKPAAEDVADEQPEPPDEDPDVAEADPTGRYLRVRASVLPCFDFFFIFWRGLCWISLVCSSDLAD
jgi:hypothetical protein